MRVGQSTVRIAPAQTAPEGPARRLAPAQRLVAAPRAPEPAPILVLPLPPPLPAPPRRGEELRGLLVDVYA